MDADGGAIANVAAPYMIRGISENEREAFAAHIVACVNFCSELDSDLLEALSGGEFKITCQRIAPALAAELADNSKQFHADHADKPVAILTGGAI
jgi:ABC-type taurine transport system ATPase subunit